MTTRPSLATGDSGSWRFERTLVTGSIAALAVVLVLIASVGPTAWILACATAAYVMVIALLGRERTAVLTMMAAFATAPMYRGIGPSVDSSVFPTDLLLVVAFALLAPTLVGRRVKLPFLFVAGLALMTVSGLVAAAFSAQPGWSIFGLAQWVVSMGLFPAALALWRPSTRVVLALAWSFVAGHVVSFALGPVVGNVADGRQYGLTHHPNALAEAGLMAVALLLFLLFEHRDVWGRTLVLAAGAASLLSVLLSGGRAATVVVAVLVLMVPIVERSAVSGFLMAAAGSLAIAALPLLVDLAGEGSALQRLAGDASSRDADTARSEARRLGLERFADHPLTGTGALNADLLGIHDTFLMVAVGIGLFGLLGLLMMIFSLARPLFGSGRLRRLAYPVWAFLGFAWTTPGILDRTLWVPVALAIFAATGTSEDDVPPDPEDRVRRTIVTPGRA